jgi:cytochrome c551/c552
VRWRKASIAVISLLMALGMLAGCVESDPQSAETPTGATTVQNSAAQTDSEGNTVAAPAGGGGGEEAPAAGGGEEDDNAGEGEGGGGAQGDAAAGVALFTEAGCGGCHVFAEAGAAGAIGPNLDETLQGKSPADIKTDILDPDTEVAEGFQPGIMPGNYETELSEDDVNNLVAALSQ